MKLHESCIEKMHLPHRFGFAFDTRGRFPHQLPIDDAHSITLLSPCTSPSAEEMNDATNANRPIIPMGSFVISRVLISQKRKRGKRKIQKKKSN